MLQVAIHDRDIGGGTGQRALDAGRGQAAPSDPLNDTNPSARALRQAASDPGRAVARIVIDEDDFPIDARASPSFATSNGTFSDSL
jgi:hypothetical protein